MKNDEDFLYEMFPLIEGWISPDGKWYECEYGEHADFAQENFSKSEEDLCEEGWVKVFFSIFSHFMGADSKGFRITKAQKSVLLKIGFTEEFTKSFYVFN